MSITSPRWLLALPYVLPFAVFLILIDLAGRFPSGVAWVYPLQTVIVAGLLIGFRRSYPEIGPAGTGRTDSYGTEKGTQLPVAVGVGLTVFFIWMLPDRLGWRYPRVDELIWMGLDRLGWHQPPPEAPDIFDPFLYFHAKWWAAAWVGLRLIRMVIVVPVMEELFWRSFLIRYLVHPDFKTVSIGAFTWFSFGVTVLLFGAEHHLWVVGILAGVIYNLLLYQTRRLSACIVAHAVTNLALGIYVLVTQEWIYL